MFRPETDWLARWARYTPNRVVLRDHRRGVEWSYAEANARATALAHDLRHDFGLGRGDRIATFSRNRSELFFLFFACIKLGTVLVPLNFRLTVREIQTLLRDCKPELLVFEESFESTIGKIPPSGRREAIERFSRFLDEPVSSLGEVGPANSLIDGDSADSRAGAGHEGSLGGAGHAGSLSEAGPADPEDLVMILYTSGTTGVPKGAMINHRMLFWNSVNTGLRLDLNSSDHTQSYAPLFHTGGWNVLFTPFLHHGASHTVLESFDPDLVLELIESERSTLLFGVPTMLQMMVDSPRFASADLSSLRYAIVGGAPMPEQLINIWHDRGVHIRQGYGLTEVGPNCFSLHQDDAVRKRGSIGFPNFYIDARIVDTSKDPIGRDCADDEAGELWLRSPVVTPGYWGKPEETEEAMTGDWFHTGDMVRRDAEGFFYVVDRKKNMFISGGENVYPAEVEAVLGNHPDVVEAAVIGVADSKWGEVGLAFVVRRGDSPDAQGLQQHCEGALARYKIPKKFEFVNQLPRNDAGKIDRKTLTVISRNRQENQP